MGIRPHPLAAANSALTWPLEDKLDDPQKIPFKGLYNRKFIGFMGLLKRFFEGLFL